MRLTKESSLALELRTPLYTLRKALPCKFSHEEFSPKHSDPIPAHMRTKLLINLLCYAYVYRGN